VTAAARVTAIGGGGGAAAAARVTGCRLGLGRLRGRDELIGQDGIEKCEISRNCLWSFEKPKTDPNCVQVVEFSMKPPLTQIAHAKPYGQRE
jgi:hypothetical protein